MSPRLQLTKAAPQVLQQYGEQTREAVAQLASQLDAMFQAERSGRIGRAWVKKLTPLFGLWCEQSGIVPPGTACQTLADSGARTPDEVTRVLRNDLGFAADLARDSADAFVAGLRAGVPRSEAEEQLLARLYQSRVHALCLQSAHVALARAVFYRVLEDQGLAQERISGPTLERALSAARGSMVGATPVPAFQLLQDMRRETENYMPLLYELRELDWWLVEAPLTPRQRDAFRKLIAPVEVELQRTLGLLDGFDFSNVDRDVWKDVYQHHLPWEERQRLGGFYTPDALVELVLDLAGWHQARNELASEAIIDISCGSGSFLVEALRRRRSTLERLRGARFRTNPTPTDLDELLSGVVGLDIHPFATFLASTNLVFQVIDLYTTVRRRHPEYRLPLNVFTVDSLEEHGRHARQARLADEIPEDIRIHHTEEEIERYRVILERRFEAVVGNPPWGGVLKGRLSPLFDPDKRGEYQTGGRFDTATDKFDIYTLFMERSLQWLVEGGRYSLLTPNTYRDRDFGAGIRKLLASEAPPETVVDLGPYGQLFFRAMNTPSITAGTKPSNYNELVVVAVGRSFSFAAPTSDREARQREIASAATSALAGEAPSPPVVAFREPIEDVKSWGSGHWPLHPLRRFRHPLEEARGVSAGAVLQPLQGVTPGGEGGLGIFQMNQAQADGLALESVLLHPVMKGTDGARWHLSGPANLALYPYAEVDDAYRPAFAWATGEVTADCLDLRPRAGREERLVSGLGEEGARERLLTHRTARGECAYPNTARYLVSHYERLASRRPKGQPLADFGRRWYEYLWPRDASRMLAQPKLVSPRLTRWPRFALDDDGILPSDSCVAIATPVTAEARHWLTDLRNDLSKLVGRALAHREMLLYALAFLNSTVAAFLLRIGREPTAKGSWNVNERYLALIKLPTPEATTVSRIIELSGECVDRVRVGTSPTEAESELDHLVFQAYDLAGSIVEAEIMAWSEEARPTT